MFNPIKHICIPGLSQEWKSKKKSCMLIIRTENEKNTYLTKYLLQNLSMWW